MRHLAWLALLAMLVPSIASAELTITIDGKPYTASGAIELAPIAAPPEDPGGGDPGNEDPPPVDPPEDPTIVERTANELAVLEAVRPLLALDTPGPDVVTCDVWFCFADKVLNPQYGDDTYAGPGEALGAWVRAGRPDGGIVLRTGTHKPKNWTGDNIIRHEVRLRGENKANRPTIDCIDGWQRTDGCLASDVRGTFTVEGVRIVNARYQRPYKEAAIWVKHFTRLVVMDTEILDGNNGIRTTGGDVAMFRNRFHNNSRHPGAHNFYLSWYRDNACRRFVAIDVISTGPLVAHAGKSRCQNGLIRGGRFEAVNGFAIDNVLGGRFLIEDVDIVQKKPSKQWVVISHGLDKLVRDTGFATSKYIHRQHEVTNIWRGRTTLRDVRIVNELNPGFAGIWNGSKYRLPAKTADGSYRREGVRFVYDPASEVFTADPVELINVTADGQPVTSVKGPSEVVQ